MVEPKNSGSSSVADYELPQKEKYPEDSFLKKAIIISGPTASRKTETSLILAKALGGEIISADSMQVYKKMDIGTAKATEKQLKQVPHHLVDIKDIAHSFNVVEFYERALEAIDNITARNKVPIIVGGTGFYIHTLIYGPPLGPPSDPKVRKLLEKDMEKFGPEALYEKLLSIDPTYAKTVTKGDKHKIIRALEIITLTEKKVSDFLRTEPTQYSPRLNFRCWFIYYPKDILYDRIEKRCDQMLDSGFLDEVKLLESLGLRDNVTASQAIGYKQALEFLKTDQTQNDYQEFVSAFKKASKRYAKRQFTWFKKEPLFRWLNLEAYDLSRSVELILHDFENTL